MKRTMLKLGAASLALSLAVSAAGVRQAKADSTEELSALANLFPATTDVYIGFRTDNGFVETLDGLLERLYDAIPTARPPMSATLSEVLDQAASQIEPGGTYADTLDPIVGDQGAFAIGDLGVLVDDKSDNDNEAQYALALQLDPGGAELLNAFIEQANAQGAGQYEGSSEEGGITLYTPQSEFGNQPLIYVSETEVVVASSRVMLPISREARLDSTGALEEAFAPLPEDDYNVVFYLDIGQVFASTFAAMEEAMAGTTMDEATVNALEQSRAVLEVLGPQAWGFTVLDGRSLTIDIAQSIDIAAYNEATGLDYAAILPPPVGSQIYQRLPAGSALVIAGSGLGPNLSVGLEQLEQQGATFSASGLDVEEVIQQLNLGARALTGQNLDEIAAWATGDYALILTPLEELGDPELIRTFGESLSGLPLEFGLVIETQDGAAAQEFAENIAQTIEALPTGDNADIEASTETIGDAEVNVITITSEDVPFPIELVIGASDDVFVFGSRNLAQTAITGDGGFAADAGVAEAQTYALPGTSALLYAASDPLLPLLNLIDNGNSMSGSSSAQSATVLADLFSTATISQVTDATTGTTLVRFVLTLPEGS